MEQAPGQTERGAPATVDATGVQADPPGGPNLDGPASLDGPQGGLVADPLVVSLGGQGAIQSEIIATINLSASINDIGDLFGNDQLARVEFGSDAHFITVTVPAPGVLAPLAGAMVLATRRRRSVG